MCQNPVNCGNTLTNTQYFFHIKSLSIELVQVEFLKSVKVKQGTFQLLPLGITLFGKEVTAKLLDFLCGSYCFNHLPETSETRGLHFKAGKIEMLQSRNKFRDLNRI